MTRPLADLIRRQIEVEGPISIAEFMSWCLGHPRYGFYMAPDRIGVAGAFTTAPEISQMFGELIGAWCAQVWLEQGRPAPFILAELGPGRGTLMADLLRAAGILPGFLDAAQVWLVETSPAMRANQKAKLTEFDVNWSARIEEIPADRPLFLVANEFFDALPIRQFRRTGDFWCERQIALGAEDRFAFRWGRARAEKSLDRAFGRVPDGTVVEINPYGEHVAGEIGRRIAANGGAALIVDYGHWDGTGETLQALRAHAIADPLETPGEADLTAHVRFRPLAEAAGAVATFGPIGQGIFLERLGIVERAKILARTLQGPALESHVAAFRRLTHPDEMGNLFQIMALLPRSAKTPPGFDA